MQHQQIKHIFTKISLKLPMRSEQNTKNPPVIPKPITCVTALALVIRRHANGCPIRAPFQGTFLFRKHLGSRVVNHIYIYIFRFK